MNEDSSLATYLKPGLVESCAPMCLVVSYDWTVGYDLMSLMIFGHSCFFFSHKEQIVYVIWLMYGKSLDNLWLIYG